MQNLTFQTKQLFSDAIDSLSQALKEPYVEMLGQAVEAIVSCYRNNGKVLVFGNGGSAADSQHICGELVGRFKKERRGLAAISLTSDTSILTAWSNDYSFESIFSRQIESLGRTGDIAWGISTSGNSKNVVNGLKKARELGLTTIGMTGNNGGLVSDQSDILLTISSKDTPRVQEAHLLGYHIICMLVEEQIG